MFHVLAAGDPLEHVLPHPLFRIGEFSITNQMFMAVVAAVLMLVIFPLMFRRPVSGPPTGARNLFESILEFLRVEVFRPVLKEHTDRFLPFLWTLFFFILFCNLLGQIPFGEIVSLFTSKPSHFGGTATGNLTTTGALALCAFAFIHLNGIVQVARDLMKGTYGQHADHEKHSSNGKPPREAAIDVEHMRGEALPADVPQHFNAMGNPVPHHADARHVGHGLGHLNQAEPPAHGKGMNSFMAILLATPLYLWNFAPHPFKPGPNDPKSGWLMDVPLWLLLLVLELVGALIKPFALMLRLFANMIAGHIVLAALLLLIPVSAGIGWQLGVFTPVMLLSLLIRVLELFVAFLQAYIFTFLTTLFIASAVAPEH